MGMVSRKKRYQVHVKESAASGLTNNAQGVWSNHDPSEASGVNGVMGSRFNKDARLRRPQHGGRVHFSKLSSDKKKQD